MTNNRVILFIDANQYLKLYMGFKSRKKLLDLLRDKQQYIFVTLQIVDEVERNKLQVAWQFLSAMAQQVKNANPPTFDAPEHFFGQSDQTATDLHDKFRIIRQKLSEVRSDLSNAAFQALHRISQSEDDVSKALANLFSNATMHTSEQFKLAQMRKERGNPPGKSKDPLGDQLSWEQLLAQCKDKSQILIVSDDSDYSVKHQGRRFLNSFLYQDLIRLNAAVKVSCFDNMLEALEDFEEKTGMKPHTPLTPHESEEIKEELNSLPNLDWLNAENLFPRSIFYQFICPKCGRPITIVWEAPPNGNRRENVTFTLDCFQSGCGWHGELPASAGHPVTS